MGKEGPLINKENDIYAYPSCRKLLIRIGCHAMCEYCGYQEGCGD